MILETQTVPLPDIDVPGRGFSRDSDITEATLMFGPENSVTGLGTAFLDVGVSFAFEGPGSSRWKASLAVLNATAGDAAPGRSAPHAWRMLRDFPGSAEPRVLGETVQVARRRLFDMPPVPSVLISIEF